VGRIVRQNGKQRELINVVGRKLVDPYIIGFNIENWMRTNIDREE
jgi:hypothetical protein